MLKIVQHETWLSEIKEPENILLRERNEVVIDVVTFPQNRDPLKNARKRVLVMAYFQFIDFLSNKPFEIADTFCQFDIFTDRDLLLIELYRMVLPVAEKLRSHIFSKNHPYFVNEEFPLEPPDVIRAKLLPELEKINQPLKPTNAALN